MTLQPRVKDVRAALRHVGALFERMRQNRCKARLTWLARERLVLAEAMREAEQRKADKRAHEAEVSLAARALCLTPEDVKVGARAVLARPLSTAWRHIQVSALAAMRTPHSMEGTQAMRRGAGRFGRQQLKRQQTGTTAVRRPRSPAAGSGAGPAPRRSTRRRGMTVLSRLRRRRMAWS